jgi:hypothetical protein
MSSSPNCIAVSPHDTIQEEEDEISQEMSPHHFMNSEVDKYPFALRKLNIGVNRNRGDSTIGTSPFNKDPLDTLTTSSPSKSYPHQYSNDIVQEDIDNWNEEELYNLSNENSKASYPHEIGELETPMEMPHEIEELENFGEHYQSIDMNKYIVSQVPYHHKATSSIYTQNTNDLNKLLYTHKRGLSNGLSNGMSNGMSYGVTSSYNKGSEMFKSNQASVMEQFKSLRVSDDVPTNYLEGQWNLYGQENQPDRVNYMGSPTPEIDENRQSSVDFRLTNSKTTTEEDLYEGMNFEEYCKNATCPAEQSFQKDKKLAISMEQRENLMKRITILKMQQTHSQSQEYNLEDSEDQCEAHE